MSKKKIVFYTEEFEKKRLAAVKKRETAIAAARDKDLRREGLKWNYSEIEDKMGRGTIRIAIVSSLNQVEFSPPYNGAQRATLSLRKHPTYGNEAMLSIESGIFLCGIKECNISVRFDKDIPMPYNVTKPSDGNTTMIFINSYPRFVSVLKKSKKMLIEAEFYQEGLKVFEFDTADLNCSFLDVNVKDRVKLSFFGVLKSLFYPQVQKKKSSKFYGCSDCDFKIEKNKFEESTLFCPVCGSILEEI